MNEAIQRKAANFLGLCVRAGRIESGQEACVALVRDEKAVLVLLDEGASENTRKRLTDACSAHHVPLFLLSSGLLGHSIGKSRRMVLAMEDSTMAQKLLSILQADNA